MDKFYVDINCDVGEGVENEDKLFPFISSCSIACGGHVGNKETMAATVALAKANNVKVGAHPAYPDPLNFGRVSMSISEKALVASIREQISELQDICMYKGVGLGHIKPHGALYNDIAKDESLAEVFLRAIEPYRSHLFLYVPYGSKIEALAKAEGFKIKREAFADRNYNNDLSLVSRNNENALIRDPKEVLGHIGLIVKEHKVSTVSKDVKTLSADTFCVHGDTPEALQILMYLSEEMPGQHIFLKK
ncbi:5-oxoprolinase subunit PxpA [Maribacter sp. MMG018]|uniref:5-oxoprolinase subunit PxpA n=1 Tax=Maribacter sp. MMG018 TaxID=2822688 RepID=UPI001B396F9C|nr:5-oxoprolinase subunit PxpA [Maribacter sp. MMG018]MBQ4915404.1 5-oxoprolinase subunit PxpA [Maribacter sp. MMG018]